jgi:hypothetical protein
MTWCEKKEEYEVEYEGECKAKKIRLGKFRLY